jgi:hypothetical protein
MDLRSCVPPCGCAEGKFPAKGDHRQIRLAAGCRDFPGDGLGRSQVDDDLARGNFPAQVLDELLVAAIEAVSDPEQGRQQLDSLPFARGEGGKILVFQVRQAFPMVAGYLRQEIDGVGAEVAPGVFPDESRGFPVMPSAVGSDAPADIVKERGAFQDEPVIIAEPVQVLEFIEEVNGEAGDMLNMRLFLFPGLHQGHYLFTGG